MSKLLQSRKAFKEKVVQLYEALAEGKDPYVKNDNFWNEFFLLKANGNALETSLNSVPNLNAMKSVINLMSNQCILAIKSDNNLRVANSLITLCSLSKVMSDKWRSSSLKFDLIDHIFGREDLENKSEILIDCLCSILINDLPIPMKTLVIKLFLILVTAYENVNKNPLIEILMSDQLFDALIQLLNVHQQRHSNGYKMILLLTILLNYRKYESSNPYIMKLSIVDDEIQLNGYAQVISNELLDFNKNFDQINNDSKSSGIFNALSNMVGNMFIADDNGIGKSNLKTNNAVLMAFYEAVHLNRNFITLLTTSPTEVYTIPCESTDTTNAINDTLESIQNPPSNLLVAFLEFSSIVMLYTKDEAILQTSRLCFIILTCITEDQCANAIMHDMNLPFTVQLHRMPMRHRKVCPQSKASRPLSYSVIDLMVEFILTHTRKNLQLDLYLLCIGVIHRLLCYQKKCKIRVDYVWKELWTALIVLMKFILNNEVDLIKRCNIFVLALSVVNIFNLFITFGDTFLPSPQSYDELYYEIIRMHSVFEHLHSMTLRYVSANESAPYKETAAKLSSALVNIKAIINHFTAKIESYSSINQISTLTEEQVLEIVRNNYDTLTLKLQDNLDQFDRYNPEKASESSFFAEILRSVIDDYRKSSDVTISTEEQHHLVQELQLHSNLCNSNNGEDLEN